MAEITQVNKYNHSKIYKICSNLTDKIYIGSTTQTLVRRLINHTSNYRHYIRTDNNYITSFEIIKLGDYYITLIEEHNYNNKQQLERREGEVMKLNINNIVNKVIVGRTDKEWRQDNIEQITENKRNYYINNKEQIKQYIQDNKEHIVERTKAYDIIYRRNNIEHKKELDRNYCKLKHTCDCGLVLAFKHLKQHLERSIHPKLIQQLFINELNNYNF